MYTNEITPIDVMHVLIENDFVQEGKKADYIYCHIMRGTTTHDYAKQMKKPEEFLTEAYSKSKCLIAAWRAVLDMDNHLVSELISHIVGLAALYIHCTEDMDAEKLQSYINVVPADKLRKKSCNWISIRSACLNMETVVRGRQYYDTIYVIRYCLYKLVNYITNNASCIPELREAWYCSSDSIDAMFSDDVKKTAPATEE